MRRAVHNCRLVRAGLDFEAALASTRGREPVPVLRKAFPFVIS
jgi:hypothetical protein